MRKTKGQILADEAVAFIEEQLRHTKGEWNNKRFKLLPWQEEIVRAIFGTLKKNGKRQYKTCYCEIPKKNGKSELAAAIALKLLYADGEPGAEIYSAAADRDQAGIVYSVAAEMVKKNPVLGRKSKVLDSTKRIIHNNGSFYRVLSAEAFSKHGYNIHGLIFDELHTQKTRELYDTLTEMSGDARSQPLTFIITTAGYDKTSICYEVHEYAQKVLDGSIIDPTFLPVIYAADPKDDWQSEETWKKCNPSLGVIIDIEKVRESCKQATEIPARENKFKQLRLNLWTEAQTRWIPSEIWKRSNHKVDFTKLEGRGCYGGMDLSTVLDIAAWTLCFPREGDEKYYQFMHRFFIPQENMTERERRDKIPYSDWIKKGLVIATPGDVIDYDFIIDRILKDAEIYEIKDSGYDPFNASSTVTKLGTEGLIMVLLRQGYLTMSPMAKDFEIRLRNNELAMNNNPVMNWMVSCTDIISDPAQNIKPVKPAREKSGKRIDGVISSIMALARAVADEHKPSIYEGAGLKTIDAQVEIVSERGADEYLRKRGLSLEAIERLKNA